MSLALYRKYRPTNFDEITGQSAIVQTLRNQVKSGRIGHAYLFHGLRGSGKTSIARILAKAVNCEHTVNGNPCNTCEHCNFKNDVNPDIIEIDAASNNGVDNIRQLIDEVNYKPTNTKYKIYIIDEVHMLSNSAFNSLLKTIEEPPEHAIFILATTEYQKVPATIKSRCQSFVFKRLTDEEIASGLYKILQQENINYFSKEDIMFIAKKGDGSMRDAISILDQCITCYEFTENKDNNTVIDIKEIRKFLGEVDSDISMKLAGYLENSNVLEGIDLIREQYYDGRNLSSMLDELYQYYFNSMAKEFGTVSGTIFERYARIIGETITQLQYSRQPLTTVEVAFIKMCKPEMEKDYNSVVQRMNNLEKELNELKNGNVTINNTSEDKLIDKNCIMYYNSSCINTFEIL